jgi:hypothetical protein
MKRIIIVILLAVLLVPAAAEEDIDLSGLSFDELAALRDRCQLEMFQREEWQEVTVPQGLWEVGVHIPAGTWVIRCADINRNDYLLRKCCIKWGTGRPDEKIKWPNGYNGSVEIYNPNSIEYSGQVTEYVVTLKTGDFIHIHPQYNQAVFSPYTGAPSFGFK